MAKPHKKTSFVRRHSLSMVSLGILCAWIVLYSKLGPSTHLGSFFGNAIADWTGVAVTVLGTKYLYEAGSAESRQPPKGPFPSVQEKLRRHSLSIFLLLTGAGWAVLYSLLDSESKWGQVIGNIVSEWTQLLGLVLLTKGLFEPRSKESHR
jgi:hypothetical protein